VSDPPTQSKAAHASKPTRLRAKSKSKSKSKKVKPKQAKPKQKPGRHKRETGQPKAERRMQHPILRLEPRLANLMRKNHRFVAH
jgi:hypothetical protein